MMEFWWEWLKAVACVAFVIAYFYVAPLLFP